MLAVGNFLGKFGQNEAVLNLIDNADDVTKRSLVDVAVHLEDKNEVIELFSKAPQLLQELLNKVGEGIDSAKAFIEDLEILLNSEGMTLEILLRLLSDLNMSVADLKDWIAKLGVNRVIELNEKYGADAMKFYGADWFAVFKGVNQDTMDHILNFDGIKKGEIKGCHDKNTFLMELSGKGEVISETPMPGRSDVVRYEYKLYQRDSTETIIQPTTLSVSLPKRKTVIDGLATDPDKWKNIGNAAVDDAIRRKVLPAAGGGFTGVGEGIPIRGYYRGDKIDSFFPDF